MGNSKIDIFGIIESSFDKMSKGQKAIARYILNNYDKAAHYTAARIGSETAVSESTVVRFAAELGFSGFPEFQKKLREDLKVKMTSVERLNTVSYEGITGNVAKTVMKSDISKLENALENFDNDSFNKACDMIMSAKRIFILGVRSSAPLASFLGFYFNLMFDNVKLIHTSSVSEIFEQIMNVRADDVVIGISFPRYSRRTIRTMQYCRDVGADVIAITDKQDNPIASNSDCALLAPSDMASFVDSLVAPLSLINVLLAELGNRNKDRISDNFVKLERIWDDYGIYDKGESASEVKHEF